jgi:hypothetical protein
MRPIPTALPNRRRAVVRGTKPERRRNFSAEDHVKNESFSFSRRQKNIFLEEMCSCVDFCVYVYVCLDGIPKLCERRNGGRKREADTFIAFPLVSAHEINLRAAFYVYVYVKVAINHFNWP